MKYEDIINLPHKQSKTRPRMAIADRAAQFAPFAALTGHNEVIKETARQVGQKIEISEDMKMELNRKIKEIAENVNKPTEIAIVYFKPDNKKDGGEYITTVSGIQKIDEYRRVIVTENENEIPIDDIIQIYLEGKQKI